MSSEKQCKCFSIWLQTNCCFKTTRNISIIKKPKEKVKCSYTDGLNTLIVDISLITSMNEAEDQCFASLRDATLHPYIPADFLDEKAAFLVAYFLQLNN